MSTESRPGVTWLSREGAKTEQDMLVELGSATSPERRVTLAVEYLKTVEGDKTEALDHLAELVPQIAPDKQRILDLLADGDTDRAEAA